MYTGFVLTAAVLGSTPSPGPFAVCHSPSPSSCFLSESSAILSIKPKDQTKEIMPTFKIIVFASFHIQRKEPTQLNPHSYSGWWNLSSGWSCCCTGWYEFPRLHTMTKGLLTPTCISVQLSSHFNLKKNNLVLGLWKSFFTKMSRKCPNVSLKTIQWFHASNVEVQSFGSSLNSHLCCMFKGKSDRCCQFKLIWNVERTGA